ncbi:MAG: hypothetical protein J3K34DRAFT_500484 [Monoraphidium minutum]|nr:MAG: hypothetical protein J3K34DRAFT_500484 [Monoraphidium minutum]
MHRRVEVEVQESTSTRPRNNPDAPLPLSADARGASASAAGAAPGAPPAAGALDAGALQMLDEFFAYAEQLQRGLESRGVTLEAGPPDGGRPREAGAAVPSSSGSGSAAEPHQQQQQWWQQPPHKQPQQQQEPAPRAQGVLGRWLGWGARAEAPPAAHGVAPHPLQEQQERRAAQGRQQHAPRPSLGAMAKQHGAHAQALL